MPSPKDHPKPSPQEVLDWMEQNGRGAKAASSYFNRAYSVDQINGWRRRGRPPPPPPGHHGDPVPRDGETPKVGSGEAKKRPRPPAAPKDVGELAASADKIDHIERNTLRAIDLRLERLSDPLSVGAKGERDTAIALGILVDKLEKIAGARRMAKGEDADTGAADEAEVMRAMGLAPE